MNDLFEQLSKLADELDKTAPAIADQVDGLIRQAIELPFAEIEPDLIDELGRLAEEEEEDIETNLTICPMCDGEGFTDESPFCEMCRGEGFVSSKVASIKKLSYIRHEKGKWNVYSKKGKRMGSYGSKAEAQKRLRQIEYFKHQ